MSNSSVDYLKPGDLKYKHSVIYVDHGMYEHARMLCIIESWIIEVFGMFVTCAYREPLHAGDLHGVIPVRAKDIRSWMYPDPNVVVDSINDKWVYDPERPDKVVALLHDSGSGAHIHLQVHPNTGLRAAL